MNDVNELLSKLGVSGRSVDRVKLSDRGVVGKTTNVVMALVAVFGIVAWRMPADPAYLFGLLVILVGVVLTYFFLTIRFASKNPGLALLEGAELLKWRQMDVSARDHPPVIDQAPSVPNEPSEA